MPITELRRQQLDTEHRTGIRIIDPDPTTVRLDGHAAECEPESTIGSNGILSRTHETLEDPRS